MWSWLKTLCCYTDPSGHNQHPIEPHSSSCSTFNTPHSESQNTAHTNPPSSSTAPQHTQHTSPGAVGSTATTSKHTSLNPAIFHLSTSLSIYIAPASPCIVYVQWQKTDMQGKGCHIWQKLKTVKSQLHPNYRPQYFFKVIYTKKTCARIWSISTEPNLCL